MATTVLVFGQPVTPVVVTVVVTVIMINEVVTPLVVLMWQPVTTMLMSVRVMVVPVRLDSAQVNVAAGPVLVTMLADDTPMPVPLIWPDLWTDCVCRLVQRIVLDLVCVPFNNTFCMLVAGLVSLSLVYLVGSLYACMIGSVVSRPLDGQRR